MPSLASARPPGPGVDNPEYFEMCPESPQLISSPNNNSGPVTRHVNGNSGSQGGGEHTPPLPPRAPSNWPSKDDAVPPSYHSAKLSNSVSPPRVPPRVLSPSSRSPKTPAYIGEYIYAEPSKIRAKMKQQQQPQSPPPPQQHTASPPASPTAPLGSPTAVHNALYHAFNCPVASPSTPPVNGVVSPSVHHTSTAPPYNHPNSQHNLPSHQSSSMTASFHEHISPTNPFLESDVTNGWDSALFSSPSYNNSAPLSSPFYNSSGPAPVSSQSYNSPAPHSSPSYNNSAPLSSPSYNNSHTLPRARPSALPPHHHILPGSSDGASHVDGLISRQHSRCSMEDIRTSEAKKQQAIADREQEERMHEAEVLRLDEIVQMCAEYQRQHSGSPPLQYSPPAPPASASSLTGGHFSFNAAGSYVSPPPHATITQNRIKTNGSLPRDKRSTPPREVLSSPSLPPPSYKSPEPPPKPPRSPRIQRSMLGSNRRNPPPPPPVRVSSNKEPAVNNTSKINENNKQQPNTSHHSSIYSKDCSAIPTHTSTHQQLWRSNSAREATGAATAAWILNSDRETLTQSIMSGNFEQQQPNNNSVSNDLYQHQTTSTSSATEFGDYNNDCIDTTQDNHGGNVEHFTGSNDLSRSSHEHHHTGNDLAAASAGSARIGRERGVASYENGAIDLQEHNEDVNNPWLSCSGGGPVYENDGKCSSNNEDVWQRKTDGSQEGEDEEQLRAEWKEALQYTTDLKRSVADLARQEEEAYRELECERALLEAECGDVEREVVELERKLQELNERSAGMDRRHEMERQQDHTTLEACMSRVECAEQELEEAERQGAAYSGTDTDTETSLLESIKLHHELLDAERKMFEDTEFGQLERESVRESEREELNREICRERNRLTEQEKRLRQLRLQVEALNASVQRESSRLDAHRSELNNRLQQERSRARTVEQKLLQLTGGNLLEAENHTANSAPSAARHTYANTHSWHAADSTEQQSSSGNASSDTDEDEVSDPTHGSRLHLLCDQLNVMTLSVTSLVESKSTRDISCAGVNQTNNPTVEDDERQLRRASVGDSWGQQQLRTRDTSRPPATTHNEQPTSNQRSGNEESVSRHPAASHRDEVIPMKRLGDDHSADHSEEGRYKSDASESVCNMVEQKEQCSRGRGGSDVEHQGMRTRGGEHHHGGAVGGRGGEESSTMGEETEETCSTQSTERHMEDSMCSEDGAGLPRVVLRVREEGAEERRPLSEASSSYSTAVTYRSNRSSNRQQRPLTRYLPVKSSCDVLQFSLRQHIESAGHQIELCPSLILTPTTCRGYLQKLGGTTPASPKIFHRRGWSKRWFVFDRIERALLYYTDKTEGKPRGYIPFEDIEEVYVDHQRVPKGASQSVSFCVKTTERTLHLLAPTASAMRIWVEVIFTGAEGYSTYDDTI